MIKGSAKKKWMTAFQFTFWVTLSVVFLKSGSLYDKFFKFSILVILGTPITYVLILGVRKFIKTFLQWEEVEKW